MKINRIKTAEVKKIEFKNNEILLPISRVNFPNDPEESPTYDANNFEIEFNAITSFYVSMEFFTKISRGEEGILILNFEFMDKFNDLNTLCMEIVEDEFLKDNVKSAAKIIEIFELKKELI